MANKERRRWPVSQAVVTFAERPDPDYAGFLSQVHLVFQDADGGSHSTHMAMRNSDLAWALGRGETIPVHYCPKDPQRTWFNDQSKSTSRGKRVAGTLFGIGVGVSLIAAMLLIRVS